MPKKNVGWLMLGSALILLLVTMSGVVYCTAAWKGKIIPGVQVGLIDVSGLTEREAEQKIAGVQQEFLIAPVKITSGDQEINTTRRDLGFSMDAKKSVSQAYQVGRSGSFQERINQVGRAYRHQVVLPAQELSVDYRKAESLLAPLTTGLVKPQDARLVIDNYDQITIIPSKPGTVVDLETSLGGLGAFKQPYAGKVELQYREEQPQVSTADVQAMGVNGLLASYGTGFDAKNYNRSYNIALAAGSINNKQIKPGEVFSFNGTVGPRSAERGYREAMVIVQDAFVPGLGGGVCQVSSTVYNAALLAGLEIVERRNHSLAVTYVPLGRDATVSYGSQDLKFRNNTGSYIYVKTAVSRGVLTVKIFGNKQQKKAVQMETSVDNVISPKVAKKNDPNLYKGKTVVEKGGAKGYNVTAYRVMDGTRKLLSKDYYRPLNRVVRVGTKAVPEPTKPKEPETEPEPGPGPEPDPDPPTGVPITP